MTDREMLELAAKAAGVTGYRYCEFLKAMAHWNESDGGWFDSCGRWDPLTNDGDALRLAVKCGIQFHIEGCDDDEMVWANDVSEYTDCNALSATRRAIVRAAALIGAQM